MAIYREPQYCPFCGELIKEIHDKQEGVPWMMQKIGDSFLRYEDHRCATTGMNEVYAGPNRELEEWLKSINALKE